MAYSVYTAHYSTKIVKVQILLQFYRVSQGTVLGSLMFLLDGSKHINSLRSDYVLSDD